MSTKGRHDPCVGIRAVPVGEAMVACVLADHFLRHRGAGGRDERLAVRGCTCSQPKITSLTSVVRKFSCTECPGRRT